ncbi:hypothetical protein G6L30_07940 [Agrobacterium rhizogenes]|nr:hypothetical protein [Rhizobium rhizogenes]
MQKLEELIDALEKATGPDRWLDAKIDAALRVGTVKMRGGGYEWAWSNFPVWAHHKQHQGMCGVQHANGDLGMIWDSLPFTSSIDATVALVERMLPEWAWYIENIKDIPSRPVISQADIWIPGIRTQHSPVERVRVSHNAPAIALVIATLRALQAKEDGR